MQKTDSPQALLVPAFAAVAIIAFAFAALSYVQGSALENHAAQGRALACPPGTNARPFYGTSMQPILWEGNTVCVDTRLQGYVPKKGDMILLDLQTPEQARAGPVVALVHQVIEVDAEKKTLVTRGVANLLPDKRVSWTEIRGTVFGVIFT